MLCAVISSFTKDLFLLERKSIIIKLINQMEHYHLEKVQDVELSLLLSYSMN